MIKQGKIDNWIYMDIKNVYSYMEYMKKRDLTSLEEEELQECLESLRKRGFENVVKALGF